MLRVILFIALIALVIYASVKPTYKVGDCIARQGHDSLYKIVEVGKYGVKAIKPYYDGYESTELDPYDLKTTTKMDCFDYFDKKGEVK